MNSDLILVMSLLVSLLAFSLIGKWYGLPLLNSLPRASALTPILLFHSFRHIGMAFLVPGVVSPNLAPSFAYPAAYGDLLAAVLAFVALTALRLHWAVAIPLVWIFLPSR